MKALQYIFKFRRGLLVVCCVATILVIWAGLAHMGSPWVLVALLCWPALYHHAAVQCERNVARCMEQMGQELLHNTTDVPGRSVPSNAAWSRAVLEVKRKGHLHAYVDAWYDFGVDEIKLTFE